MLACKSCLKFKSSLNEFGVCGKCARSHGIGTSRKVSFEKRSTDRLSPILSDGTILSREQWYEMKLAVDRFYYSISDAEVEKFNKSLSDAKESEKQSSENTRRHEVGFVYLVVGADCNYKIGKADDVDKRLSSHKSSNPSISLEWKIRVRNYHGCEMALHRYFDGKRIVGEWFALTEDDVGWLKAITSSELERLASDSC